MGKVKIALIILGIVLVIYLLMKAHILYYGNYRRVIKKPQNGKKSLSIPSDKFKMSSPDNGLAFTLSFWLFIDDWNYKFMNEKNILEKGHFKVFLSPRYNNLVVEIPIYNNSNKSSEMISFNNIPLQKWINVTIILENRYLDLWINGKLYSSRHLSNLPLIEDDAPITLFDNGGFGGYMSKLFVWEYNITKRVIYRIFDKGPTKVSILEYLIGLFNDINLTCKINFKRKKSEDTDDD